VEGDSENEQRSSLKRRCWVFRKIWDLWSFRQSRILWRAGLGGLFYRKAGITPLCDTIINIGNAFYLAGRYDEHFRNRKTIGEILGSQAREMPIIPMDHRPTELQEVSRTATNVQFSGYTHNGQLFPINLIVGNMFELSWGYMKIRNTHFSRPAAFASGDLR